ncbi:hypothetical protein ACM01_35110 [Streptomyces viridochromogenes]|uniref:Uncharacterized protein n=1 Tax=Streptomyces viridochromogenes TaxID=1938 RepID=A0A0J7Z1D6_STRVR|nr:hypothetical protein [Streptomyces viridochromogenes]KMS69427.1 hypothetical protein ACM01_35110 [Streptomyces viridochromogenes]
MTAENDGRNGREGYDGRTGVDALMAALTDEPLTAEARADAAFMAEHRSAAADVALLREQLEIIGHALAEPPAPASDPEPDPAPPLAPIRVRQPSRARRRVFAVAFGGLAVAAAGSVLVGMGWLLAQGEGAQSDSGTAADKQVSSEAGGGTAFGSPGYLACSSLVAEGKATSVERLPGTTSLRVALHMTRYYKPDKGGEPELTFVVDENLVPGLRVGDQVLLGIPEGARQPDFWAVGEQDIAPERAWITASLPKSSGRTCGG